MAGGTHNRREAALREMLRESWRVEEQEPFAGWDFTYLSETGRVASAPLPWNYVSMVLPSIRAQIGDETGAMLDMGTGGGELLSLLRPLPALTCATEGYAPNVPIARARLEPLGVQVAEIDDTNVLPFPDETFGLVINRHEYYRPEEVKRVLRPGCSFITQQVGVWDARQICDWLDSPYDVPWKNWTLTTAMKQLTDINMRVYVQHEAETIMRFYDVGALIYYLKIDMMLVPDFTVDRYFDALVRLHKRIETEGYVDAISQRFILIANKGIRRGYSGAHRI